MRLLAAWLLSLIVVACATLAYAQTHTPFSRILSAEDIGFRVEGMDPKGRPTGVFVVRINGEWREVGSTFMVRPVR
jgi:hypothetical protein